MQSLKKRKIAVIYNPIYNSDTLAIRLKEEYDLIVYKDCETLFHQLENGLELNLIIVSGDIKTDSCISIIKKLKSSFLYKYIPVILVSDKIDNEVRREALKIGLSEIVKPDVNITSFFLRTDYLINKSLQVQKLDKEVLSIVKKYRIPTPKRIFDITFSLLVLLMLLPVFIVIAILIRFESKGPIFYASKRVGTGYKIFDFYKFRSMSQDADKKIKDLAALNQYTLDAKPVPLEEFSGLCSECTEKETACQAMLYHDGDTICEKLHKRIKQDANGATFIKIKGDPRVTRIGHFIRNTSIDELPQLFNVLKGDMSIVGNRPLPLYEAEKITTDRFITRFMAPSGITGLWQVTKRGRGKMSEEERIELDNVYATQHSFWGDIKIILKTIPALLQKENV